jgi:SAM-dependent methyltransferase
MKHMAQQPIDPERYSEEYYLTTCDGHAEYLAGGGRVLAERLQALWVFLRAGPGMRVLDVGCGRGEIVVQCGLAGVRAVGIDYAEAGLRLAQRAIARIGGSTVEAWRPPALTLGNGKQLPFRDDSFDRAALSDIVEHLYPGELRAVLAEVYRVLAPGGELLIHTMPNLWYYRYGYPLFRLLQRLQGVPAPADPRDRFPFSEVHVNEQTPRTMSRALAESPFRHWRVWLHDYRSYAEHPPLMRRVMRLLTGLPGVRWMFCDDIFARARK